MSLVNELQEIAETADILTVLRKAKRVSGKLGRTDIVAWIDKELKGYDPEDEVPDYRHGECFLVYNTNGYMPAGFGYLKDGIERVQNWPSTPVDIRTDIGTLASKKEGQIMVMPLPPETESRLKLNLRTNWHNSEIINQISLMLETPSTGINKIIQSVRDRVLDWAIKLEQEGITGEKYSFTKKEKEAAQNMNVMNFGSMKTVVQDGDNPTAIQVDEYAHIQKNNIFDYICSWYGAIIGGTASILGVWLFLWKEWGVWFFGL